MDISIRDDFIKLGQAMKLGNLVSDGVQAKMEILSGNVSVNGHIETQRGEKLYPGDTFVYQGKSFAVTQKSD